MKPIEPPPHSPAPWRVQTTDFLKLTIRSADHRTVATITPQLPTETERNANLIACAPALLKACQQISALWPEEPNCADVLAVNGINDGKSRAILLDAALKIARNVVAEAKGQADAVDH